MTVTYCQECGRPGAACPQHPHAGAVPSWQEFCICRLTNQLTETRAAIVQLQRWNHGDAYRPENDALVTAIDDTLRIVNSSEREPSPGPMGAADAKDDGRDHGRI